MSQLGEEIRGRITGGVDDSLPTLQHYSRDASLFSVQPEVVVMPKNAQDVEDLVLIANEKRNAGEHISLTARSAGTDMSGGPLNDSIILDMTAGFNRIVEISDSSSQTGYAIVEPGVFFRNFDRET